MTLGPTLLLILFAFGIILNTLSYLTFKGNPFTNNSSEIRFRTITVRISIIAILTFFLGSFLYIMVEYWNEPI